jgi:tellurium resistance protein TerD
VIEIDLGLMTPNAAKVAFVVTIHDAEARKQNFGQVSNAYIRALNTDGGAEIARYDLSEDASTETAMIFGELYRHNDEWKFKAIGQGYAGGLAAVARDFGVISVKINGASRTALATPGPPTHRRAFIFCKEKL